MYVGENLDEEDKSRVFWADLDWKGFREMLYDFAERLPSETERDVVWRMPTEYLEASVGLGWIFDGRAIDLLGLLLEYVDKRGMYVLRQVSRVLRMMMRVSMFAL